MPLFFKMATPQQRCWCVLQSAKKESVTAVQRAFRTQYTWNQQVEYPFTRITTAIASITRDTAQSLGRVGSSSRHVPCASRSTYRVSVRCVQNFESFSIDWCRCEALSTSHLFSVSFWKCKVLLCSPYKRLIYGHVLTVYILNEKETKKLNLMIKHNLCVWAVTPCALVGTLLQCHNPEDHNRCLHCRGNIKS
jgi:hypothetical protein